MTDELQQIADQIKVAAEKTTPRPWYAKFNSVDSDESQIAVVDSRTDAAFIALAANHVLEIIAELEKAEEYIDEHINSSEWVKQIRELEAQLDAAREALRVFAERANWTDSPATPGSSLNAGWYGAATPWEIARKALEAKK